MVRKHVDIGLRAASCSNHEKSFLNCRNHVTHAELSANMLFAEMVYVGTYELPVTHKLLTFSPSPSLVALITSQNHGPLVWALYPGILIIPYMHP